MGLGLIKLNNHTVNDLTAHMDGPLTAHMLVYLMMLPVGTKAISLIFGPKLYDYNCNEIHDCIIVKIWHEDIPKVPQGERLPWVTPWIEAVKAKGSNESYYRLNYWEIEGVHARRSH